MSDLREVTYIREAFGKTAFDFCLEQGWFEMKDIPTDFELDEFKAHFNACMSEYFYQYIVDFDEKNNKEIKGIRPFDRQYECIKCQVEIYKYVAAHRLYLGSDYRLQHYISKLCNQYLSNKYDRKEIQRQCTWNIHLLWNHNNEPIVKFVLESDSYKYNRFLVTMDFIKKYDLRNLLQKDLNEKVVRLVMSSDFSVTD